ncbi:MAG: hypothetical protein RIG63_04140 [Coleofasciculus chthonoplastes F3-SA18-01]
MSSLTPKGGSGGAGTRGGGDTQPGQRKLSLSIYATLRKYQRLSFDILGRLAVRSRYDIVDLIGNKSGNELTVGYARVSSQN